MADPNDAHSTSQVKNASSILVARSKGSSQELND